METPSLTNNTSAGVSSSPEAFDIKSFLYGLLIGLVLCSPCVFYTGRRLAQIIRTKLYVSGRISIPEHPDSCRSLLNQHVTSSIENSIESGYIDGEENEKFGLLKLEIFRDSLNLNLSTEAYSELNSDEESGIGENMSRNTSISNISNMRETAHPTVCEMSLSNEGTCNKQSKHTCIETISKELKETELKLTSPVNRTNDAESANNEHASALRECVNINDDQSRGINWDLVFQKSADLVNPLEYYEFFIALFGAVGINNAGRIIEEIKSNNPHNTKTAIIKLFLRWREHAGNRNIELHIENTFRELGWNSNCEDFRKIMSNPPLTQTNTLSQIVANLPLVPTCHSASLSLDFPIHDESTIVLAHQQDEKIETRVEQTITINGVTRKIVHQKTSEIMRHDKYQCVRGGKSEVKNPKHKLEPPSEEHIDKVIIPNKSRKISECLESSERIDTERNDNPCEENESTNNNYCIIGNNNNPPQNNEENETHVNLTRNYKCGKAKSRSTLARYKGSRHNSRRKKYCKGSESLHSYTESTSNLYSQGQNSSTESSELPMDSGYSSSRPETGLYRVDASRSETGLYRIDEDEEIPSLSACLIVKLIQQLLSLKQPLDKEYYDFYQTHIINRITKRFQTKEQVLQLKLDEFKNKIKGYFLQAGDRLLGFSEDDCNSMELYIENARSRICNSSETDVVFINYNGIPLKDVV